MGKHAHTEAVLSHRGDGLADMAHADDAHRQAGDLARPFGMRAAGEPARSAQVAVDHAKPAGERQASEDHILANG
jgi:hypothetical protein